MFIHEVNESTNMDLTEQSLVECQVTTRVSPKDFELFLSKNPIGRNASLFRNCNDCLLTKMFTEILLPKVRESIDFLTSYLSVISRENQPKPP